MKDEPKILEDIIEVFKLFIKNLPSDIKATVYIRRDGDESVATLTNDDIIINKIEELKRTDNETIH